MRGALAHIPGDEGWPLVGHTLSILADPKGFVERRIERYGPVYRTRVFGETNVTLLSPNAGDRHGRDLPGLPNDTKHMGSRIFRLHSHIRVPRCPLWCCRRDHQPALLASERMDEMLALEEAIRKVEFEATSTPAPDEPAANTSSMIRGGAG